MFIMRFHALFDRFFSKELQNKRRLKREYFARLIELSPEKWTVRMSEYGPWFQTVDHNGDMIELELRFYDYCLDGVRVFAIVMTNLRNDNRFMIGRLITDPHPFNRGPRRESRQFQSCYVDILYKKLLWLLKNRIAEVEQSGNTDQRNQEMEEDYEKFRHSIRGF